MSAEDVSHFLKNTFDEEINLIRDNIKTIEVKKIYGIAEISGIKKDSRIDLTVKIL